ncbi:WYL domain-containing protein [Streptomyces sp. NPDC058049]|uniref:WYL domain-containing protein n=1 Tax=Streptomyces sp. NPDC058049 TaxID=3346314 RepID=UPI0036ECB4CB
MPRPRDRHLRLHPAPGRARLPPQPHSLVPAMGHWYLVAYDTRAEDWRIYRLDRTAGPAPTGHRVPARTLPAPDPAAFVAAKVATAPARHRAVATVHAPAVAVLARTQGLPGRVTPIDDATCTVDLSGGPSPVSPSSWRPWTPTTRPTPTPKSSATCAPQPEGPCAVPNQSAIPGRSRAEGEVSRQAFAGSNSGLRASKTASVCWYVRWAGVRAGPFPGPDLRNEVGHRSQVNSPVRTAPDGGRVRPTSRRGTRCDRRSGPRTRTRSASPGRSPAGRARRRHRG